MKTKQTNYLISYKETENGPLLNKKISGFDTFDIIQQIKSELSQKWKEPRIYIESIFII